MQKIKEYKKGFRSNIVKEKNIWLFFSFQVFFEKKSTEKN